MKATLLSIVGLLCVVAPANAHGNFGLGLFGGFGGLGGWGPPQGEWVDHHSEWGVGHGDLFGLGLGLGLGFGFFDADQVQMRFEDRFNALQTQYNDGVAGGSDFFSSEEYDLVVNKTERLDDRYGLFVSGVERSIDRLGDVISIVNDDVTFFNDLLTNYQNDEDISPARLERIELWIGRITDRLNMKIDTLTETQTTLQTNLPTYQAFQTDVSTFLSDIVTAGGGTPDASLTSLKSLASLAVQAEQGAAMDGSQFGALSLATVPEPAAAGLVAVALCGFSARRCRRQPRTQ